MKYFLFIILISCCILTKAQNDTISSCNCMPDTIPVFVHWEKIASFPGGEEALIKFFQDSLIYPQKALDNLLEDRVYITFCIRETGALTDLKIVRGKYDILNEEAIRFIKSMPDWEPAQSRGKNICMNYMLPVNFSLVKPTKREHRKRKNKKEK